MNAQTREVLQYILDTYGVEPEYPWMTSPENAIFRNVRTEKWFAVLLGDLPHRCLGLPGEERQDVLNLKCDPIMTFTLIDQKSIFKAYHMNKEHWISVLLDGTLPMDKLIFLMDLSYRLVDRTNKRTR